MRGLLMGHGRRAVNAKRGEASSGVIPLSPPVFTRGAELDYLAAAEHVDTGASAPTATRQISRTARETSWESRPARTLSVARAVYRMLPDDARMWQSGQSFVVIERPRITAALAA